MENDIRVALAVLNAQVDRTDDNLSHTVRWAEAAHDAGANIVCFPETNVTGYANNTIIHSSAETAPGPSTEVLSALASRCDMVILAVAIGPAGKIVKNDVSGK